MSASSITADEFDREVLQSTLPVLIDFWGEGCPPCRMIAPHIDSLSEEFAGKAKVFKVNTDTETDLAARYRVMSIPALIFFHNGEVVDQMIGAAPKSQIESRLNKLVSG